jgi:hypothetical protein
MKNLILSLTVILGIQNSIVTGSDFTQTIRGTVIDAITGYPLIGATIILSETNPPIGTITDPDGVFVLNNVPVGRQSLEISYVGYLPRKVENLFLTSAKEVVVEVQLEESTIEVEEVVVKAKKKKDEALNEMAMVSSRTFSVEETERFAGSLGDPARMVANYAGVMTQNDSRNDIIIRGNSPSGVLWRIEGVEVPNPNHFGELGTTGGPVSMINNNLLTNSDFLTGAFPAEYGNATAGAFDLNLRSGNNEVTEFTGQIGFNGFELGAEGPFVKRENNVNPSYLANFRYSTLEVVHMMGLDIGTGAAIPQYKDFTFMVDLPGTKLGRLKLFGLWGKSYIELGREEDDENENSYNPRGWAVNFGSDLAVAGLTHTYFINENIRFRSTLSYQTTQATTEVDSVDYKVDMVDPYFRSTEKEDKISFSTQFRHKISSHDNYSIGIIADMYSINYIDSVQDQDYNRFITITDAEGNMNMLRAYAQWQHKFNDYVTTYAGVHSQYFDLNNEIAIEPRVSVKWQFSPKQSLNAGFGMHSQLQPRYLYCIQTYDDVNDSYSITNEDVKYTRSNHYVLGYNYLVSPDFRVKLETYYQNLYNVPVSESSPEFSMLNTGGEFGMPAEDSLVNKGTGRNYGLELTLEKFLSKGYYALFTASLFDSKYKGYDGIERNTAFNGNYVFNLLAGYEHKISKKAVMTFDIKTVWAGGKRYVPIDLEESRLEGEEVRDWSNAFKDKYDDYFRTDLRIGLKLNGKRVNQEWGLDLQNVTGFRSVFMEGYDAVKDEVYTVYQQGFMPMMLWRINF